MFQNNLTKHCLSYIFVHTLSLQSIESLQYMLSIGFIRKQIVYGQRKKKRNVALVTRHHMYREIISGHIFQYC